MSTNPYTPPQADLASATESTPRSIWWKLYFALVVLLQLLTIAVVLPETSLGPIETIDLPASMISLLGMWAFAFQRQLGRARFWQIWFPVIVTWDMVILFYFVPQGLAYALSGSDPTTATENLFSLALGAPLYAALYLYAFRSNDMWSARDST